MLVHTFDGSMAGRSNRLFRRGEILELEISELAYGGKGIGKIETPEGMFTVFVQNTFPGQKVKARVIKCKRRYAECKLEKVVIPSKLELYQPYQRIPGAPYSLVPIKEQHKYKKQTTLELFRRIGHVEDIDSIFDQFLPSPLVWHYRNKMEYSFSEIRFDLGEEKEFDDFGLGFKHRGTWWSVENLDNDSGLFDKQFESNISRLREFCQASGLAAWHPPKKKGFFRFLVVRKSQTNDQLLINLVTTTPESDRFDFSGFVNLLLEILGERLAGVIHSTNDDTSDRVEAREGLSRLIFGKETLTESILGLEFEISMSSFFQTNPSSAERLYSLAVQYATDGQSPETVYMDLFCGTGTIAQVLASRTTSTVIGVDIVTSAIENAVASARKNGLNNVKFIAADAGKFLYEHPEYLGAIDCVMLDPPRAGIAPKTLQKVITLDAQRIVYISCNPATQARDTEALILAGYQLKKISLCDQFPHTSHIESIALFDKPLIL
jgi:23S rRNA (uracil1939-C5)-methyltransferase